MRKFLSISTVLLMAFFVVSCGSSEPDDLPVSQNATASKSYEIVASANSTSTLKTTFNLNDFSAISSYVKFVKSAGVQSTSSYSVSGLPTGQSIELSNVKLYLANDSKKSITLPNITGNAVFNEVSQLAFLQSVMDEIVRRGSAEVVFTYTPNVTVTSGKLTIKIDANFKFQ